MFPGSSVGKEPVCNAGNAGWMKDPSLGQEDPLEKERANLSIIFSWKIPWTEEPSGLQSMGSQRVEHDWVTNTFSVKVGVIYVKLKGILFIKKYFWLKQF